MTTNQPELKACPMPQCLSNDVHLNHHGCFIECRKCNFCMEWQWQNQQPEVIQIWNSRPSPIIPEDAVTIAELREILGIKNKADESVIEHVKEILRVNRKMFAEWQKTFFEETDAKNAVQPVTDDDLRDAILDAQNFIDDKYEGSITRSTVQTLVTRAIKGQSK